MLPKYFLTMLDFFAVGIMKSIIKFDESIMIFIDEVALVLQNIVK